MEVKDKYINLECINKSRTILLGIATLLVTFFHMYSLDFYELINIRFVANILTFVKSIGNVGVDIFLFLSGIGLYFSYTKNNLKQFYMNRFVRILPGFILVVFIYNIITRTMTVGEIFESVFFVSFFIDGIRDGWFLQFIMVLYLIFPLIYKIIKRYDIYGLFVGLLFVVLFNFLYAYFFSNSYFNIEVGLTRIPIFLIGVFLGKKIYEKKKISLNMFIFSIIIQVLISIIAYINLNVPNFVIILRYLYCPLAISLIINVSCVYSLIVNKEGILFKILKFFGNHSLEFYLIYEKLCYILYNVCMISSYTMVYLIGFFLTIVFAYLLKKIIVLFVGRCSGK